jgi:hypothetical protein
MEVRYFINEKNLKTNFGVYVASSEGVLDLPKIKDFTRQDWHEYHGIQCDLEPPKLQEREITLDCWMTASDQLGFIQRLNLFYAEFLKSGYKRLRIEIDADAASPIILVYDTLIKESVKITKKWTAGTQQGKFKLKLVEPNPQKKVLHFESGAGNNRTCALTLYTTMEVTIAWGDGTYADIAASNGYTAAHSYAEYGDYYISISGVVSEITRLTLDSSTEVIWEIL